MKLRQPGFARSAKLLICFLLPGLFILKISAQPKIELAEFKSSDPIGTKDFFCDKIKGCKDVETAYNTIVGHFILAKGDYFKLFCYTGCQPPLRKEFGRQPVPGAHSEGGPGAGYSYKPKIIIMLPNQAGDTASLESARNMAYSFNSMQHKTHGFAPGTISCELRLPASSMEKYFEYEKEKDILSDAYLVLLDSYQYTERPKKMPAGAVGAFPGRKKTGELKYTLRFINPVSRQIVAKKDVTVEADRKPGAAMTDGMSWTMNRSASEKGAGELINYLNALQQKHTETSETVLQTEGNAAYTTLQVDSLMMPVEDLKNIITGFHPVTNMIRIDNTRYVLKFFCSGTYLLNLVNESPLKNHYHARLDSLGAVILTANQRIQ